MRDPLFYWRQNKDPVKICEKCAEEIRKSEKFVKLTINGAVTYRHDKKCA